MKNKYLLLLFAIPLLLVVWWFRHGNILGGGESGLPFYNLERQTEITRYSWADPALGNSLGIGIAAAPFFRFTSFLQSLGVPGFILESIFFWLLFVTSGVSIWFLTKELFPKLDAKYLFLSVLFYWFNPVSLVSVWNRFLYNYMAFWALFPLAVFLFIMGIKRGDYKLSLLISLFSAVFSYALTSTVFVILLWFSFFYIFMFYFIFGSRGRTFYLSYLFLTLFSFILFNFWWIIQFFSFLFSSGYIAATSTFFTSGGNLSTLSELSRRLGQFINTLRFMHGTFFLDGPFWAKIYSIPLVAPVEFFSGGVILWCIYKLRKEGEVLLFGSFFILSLFLTKGNAPPFGGLFQTLFLKLTVLQVFRNPFEKFSFLVLLASSPLFVLGVDTLLRSARIQKFKNLLFLAVFIFIFGFWGFPFLTGLVFTSNEAVGSHSLRNYEVKPPSYYRDANNWLMERSGNFRFISLPIGGEAINYSWEKPYAGVELSSAFFTTPNISFNTTIPLYTDLASNLSKYQLGKEIFNFFPYTASRYIVWRSDIDFKERKMPDPVIVRKQLDIWTNEGRLTKVFEKDKLAIFEINAQETWPKIYVTPNMFFSNERSLVDLSAFDEEFPRKKLAVIDYSHLGKDQTIDEGLVIRSNSIFSPVPIPKDLSDKDIIDRLFYSKHIPGEPFYFLVRLKEILETPPKSDYPSWIIFKTGLLGKRAVELYKLHITKADSRLTSKAESDYVNLLRELNQDLTSDAREERSYSLVVKESLIYQWILLSRVRATSLNELTIFLANSSIRPTFNLSTNEDSVYTIYNFYIPTTGRYKLINLNGSKIDALLDGQPLDVTKSIELAGGQHEVAILKGTEEIKPQFELSGLKVSEDSPQEWDLAFAGVPERYKIEFDFKFEKGNMFYIRFVQNVDKPASPIFDARIVKDEMFHGWAHWDSRFTTSAGAVSGKLSISPVVNKICEKNLLVGETCKTETKSFDVEIKNLKITPRQRPNLLFVSNIKESQNEETTSTFTKINPTLYKIKLSKPTPQREILVFSELYDSGWKANYENGEKIPEANHFLVNVYANGWLIDKPGNYEITLKYQPQELTDLGRTVSVISLMAGTVFLAALTYRGRRL